MKKKFLHITPEDRANTILKLFIESGLSIDQMLECLELTRQKVLALRKTAPLTR